MSHTHAGRRVGPTTTTLWLLLAVALGLCGFAVAAVYLGSIGG